MEFAIVFSFESTFAIAPCKACTRISWEDKTFYFVDYGRTWQEAESKLLSQLAAFVEAAAKTPPASKTVLVLASWQKRSDT